MKVSTSQPQSYPMIMLISRCLGERRARLGFVLVLSCSSCGDERHLLLECPAMRPIRQRFAHLFAKSDTVQMFIWQEDLFSVACYICACMKHHATLLEE